MDLLFNPLFGLTSQENGCGKKLYILRLDSDSLTTPNCIVITIAPLTAIKNLQQRKQQQKQPINYTTKILKIF